MNHKILYSNNPANWRDVTQKCIIAVGKNRLIIVFNGLRRTPEIAAAYFWNSDMCAYLPDEHKPTPHDEEIINEALNYPIVHVQETALLYTEDEVKKMSETDKWDVCFYEDKQGNVYRKVHNEIKTHNQ